MLPSCISGSVGLIVFGALTILGTRGHDLSLFYCFFLSPLYRSAVPNRCSAPLICSVTRKSQGLSGNCFENVLNRTYSSNQLLALHHVHNLQRDVLPTTGLSLLRTGSQVRTADDIRMADQWPALRRLLRSNINAKMKAFIPFNGVIKDTIWFLKTNCYRYIQ